MSTGHHIERWVECPTCNRKITRARVTCSVHKCSCGQEFTACVTRDFIAIILHDANDNLSTTERIKRFQKQLYLLAEYKK